MKQKNNASFKTNNEDIEQKSVFKYLGSYLDKKLEFIDHIDIVNTKLTTFCNDLSIPKDFK